MNINTCLPAAPHPRIVSETASNWLTKNVYGLVVSHLQYFKHDEKVLEGLRRLTLASQEPEDFYLRLELYNGGGFELFGSPAQGKGEELTPGLRRWLWMPNQPSSPELSLLAIEYRSILTRYIHGIYSKCFIRDKTERLEPYPYVRVGKEIALKDKLFEDVVLSELMINAVSIRLELTPLHLKINSRQFQTGMIPKVTGKIAANFK